jgi:hypothetical protein
MATPAESGTAPRRWLSDHEQVGIDELGVFIGLASEWQDSPEWRALLEADIIDEARLVVVVDRDRWLPYRLARLLAASGHAATRAGTGLYIDNVV